MRLQSATDGSYREVLYSAGRARDGGGSPIKIPQEYA